MKYILYKLSFPSGKNYIGQTIKGMHSRMIRHKTAVNTGSMLAVHCAWRKYGEPEIEIIGKYKSQKELNEAEIKAIKDFNTLTPNGYNLSYGGENAPSVNPVVARKIGKKNKGLIRSKKEKERMSKQALALWQTDEYRENVSKGLKSIWDDKRRKETSKRMKRIWKEKKANGYEFPEHQREILKNKVVSEETRKKMSEAAKKRKRGPRSQSFKDKVTQKTKEAWQDPELTEKRVKSIRAAWTPEKRAKMSELAKKRWQNKEYRENVMNAKRKK